MFEKWKDRQKKRQEAVAEARAKFSSFIDVVKSPGWKIYQKSVEQKAEYIRKKIENDLSLTGEELKRLQLALQIYKEVKRIPKELENNAKGGKR